MKLITTSTVIALTQPGFESFTDVYPTVAKEYESFTDMLKTERSYEVTSEIAMMQASQYTPEGAASYSDTIQGRGRKYFYVKKYTLQIAPTEEQIADNLYREQMTPAYGTAFMQSHILRQNLLAAKVLNEGWTNATVGWDNLPYFSEEHPITDGVQSNTLPYASPLHMQSLNKLMSRLWYLKAANGMPVPENHFKLLIVAPPMLPQATVVMNSVTKPGTSSFELNPANELQYAKEGIQSNRFVIPNGYFFRTRIIGFKEYMRETLKTLQAPDPQNWSLIISSFMRLVISFDNWRSMYAARAPLVENLD